MRKIFFASPKMHVPLGEGGAETIVFDLLSEAHRNGDTIKSLGAFNYLKVESLNETLKRLGSNLFLEQQPAELMTLRDTITYPSFSHAVYQMPESYTITLAREDHFSISFSEYLKQFSPDFVFLQAENCVPLYLECKAQKKKVAYYVQTPHDMEVFSHNGITPPPLWANSRFLQDVLKKRYGYASELLYPAIDSSRYLVADKEKRTGEQMRVLFINPAPAKGAEIFLELARVFSNIKFSVLEGWENFDARFTEACRKLPNVVLLPKTWNMASVYKGTDLLLVPSQWEEAFGRVVVEAHAAGVPTLASAVGGLPEASGDAGMLVENYRSAEAWKRTLKHLVENPTALTANFDLLKQNPERFTSALAYQRLLKLLDQL